MNPDNDIDFSENDYPIQDLPLIKWHSYFEDEDTYYEISCHQNDEKKHPKIKFINNRKIINERKLSKFELNSINNLLEGISIKLIKKSLIEVRITCEYTDYKLSIKDECSSVTIIWNRSDEEIYPDYYRKILDLTNAIEQMIDIDFIIEVHTRHDSSNE